MSHFRLVLSLIALVSSAVLCGNSSAQAAENKNTSGAASKLAPGVLTTIPPDRRYGETVSAYDIVELRDTNPQWQPHYTPASRTLHSIASDAKLRRKIWALEFSFKPVRMIYVDVPQPSGKMQRKLIWYLVYSVRNTGEELEPTKKDDGTYEIVKTDQPVWFVPLFLLRSHEFDKTYLDRVVPAAVEPIERRERISKLLTTIEMAETPIPVSTARDDRSVWGVAMWEDVDPRIDFFSVYVEGLTNAYRTRINPANPPQAGDPPGKGRQFQRKTLQLNFWRPGDTVDEHEREIRYGMPVDKAKLYNVDPGVDYTWIYQ